MRQILVFAALMIALAAVAPKLLRPIGGNVTAAGATAEPSRPESPYPRTASIPRGANGHFEADAVIDGHHMGFMVDTGASVIALRRQEAARHPSGATRLHDQGLDRQRRHLRRSDRARPRRARRHQPAQRRRSGAARRGTRAKPARHVVSVPPALAI
jgi:hypothetical protein